ncbi:hypothetical protein ACJ41O_003504 [Fusarium nematophilum]
MAETGISAPKAQGTELRLTCVPNHMSAQDLQLELSRVHLKIKYAFRVILEKSSEELFWNLLQHEGLSVKMLLRESQLKFQVPDSSNLDLRIVSTAAGGRQSLFLTSALKAFEDSGADTTEIEKTYEHAYAKLMVPSSDGLDILQQIHTIPYALSDDDGIKGRHCLLELAIRLKEQELPDLGN